MANKDISLKQKVGDTYNVINFRTTTDNVMYDDDTTVTERLYEVANSRYPYNCTVLEGTSFGADIEAHDMCPCGDGYVMCGDGFIKYSWDGLTWNDIDASAEDLTIIQNHNWLSCCADVEYGGACIVLNGDQSLMRSNMTTPNYLSWQTPEGRYMAADENIMIVPRLTNTTATPKAYSYNMIYGLGGRPPVAAAYKSGEYTPKSPEYPKQVIMAEGKAIILTEKGTLTYSENTEVNGFKELRYDPDIPATNIKDNTQVIQELQDGLQFTMWHYPIWQWPISEINSMQNGLTPIRGDYPYDVDQEYISWFRRGFAEIMAGVTKGIGDFRYRYIAVGQPISSEDVDEPSWQAKRMKLPVAIFSLGNNKVSELLFGVTKFEDDDDGKVLFYDDDIFRPVMTTSIPEAMPQGRPGTPLKPIKKASYNTATDKSKWVYGPEATIYAHEDGSVASETPWATFGSVIYNISLQNSSNGITFTSRTLKYQSETFVIYEIIDTGRGYVMATDKGVMWINTLSTNNIRYTIHLFDLGDPTKVCSEKTILTSDGFNTIVYDPSWQCTYVIH